MKSILFLFLLLFLSFTLSAQDLTKDISYDFKVTENGSVEARRITRIIEAGETLSTSYYRFNGVIEPGESIPAELPDNIKAGIKASWTKAVIEKFREEKASKEKRNQENMKNLTQQNTGE
jgi:hypothetical protein